MFLLSRTSPSAESRHSAATLASSAQSAMSMSSADNVVFSASICSTARATMTVSRLPINARPIGVAGPKSISAQSWKTSAGFCVQWATI